MHDQQDLSLDIEEGSGMDMEIPGWLRRHFGEFSGQINSSPSGEERYYDRMLHAFLLPSSNSVGHLSYQPSSHNSVDNNFFSALMEFSKQLDYFSDNPKFLLYRKTESSLTAYVTISILFTGLFVQAYSLTAGRDNAIKGALAQCTILTASIAMLVGWVLTALNCSHRLNLFHLNQQLRRKYFRSAPDNETIYQLLSNALEPLWVVVLWAALDLMMANSVFHQQDCNDKDKLPTSLEAHASEDSLRKIEKKRRKSWLNCDNKRTKPSLLKASIQHQRNGRVAPSAHNVNDSDSSLLDDIPSLPNNSSDSIEQTEKFICFEVLDSGEIIRDNRQLRSVFSPKPASSRLCPAPGQTILSQPTESAKQKLDHPEQTQEQQLQQVANNPQFNIKNADFFGVYGHRRSSLRASSSSSTSRKSQTRSGHRPSTSSGDPPCVVNHNRPSFSLPTQHEETDSAISTQKSTPVASNVVKFKIIGFSAKGDELALHEAFSGGMDAFIHKPFTIQAFSDAYMHSIHSNSHPQSSSNGCTTMVVSFS
eukprot:gene8962-9890_t